MATQGPDPMQQQSAQLANQAVQDNARREQSGGKKKSPFANWMAHLGSLADWGVLDQAVGNLQASANFTKELSLPGIVNHMKMKTSLLSDSAFAQRDVQWFFDKMKEGASKEDLALQETQKKQQEQSEREQLRHKSFEDPNRAYNEQNQRHSHNQGHDQQQQQQHQPHRHQDGQHDDSNRNYMKHIQMAENQRRMNVTNKNDHQYDLIMHDAHNQKRWMQEIQANYQFIAQIHQHQQAKKHKQSRVI